MCYCRHLLIHWLQLLLGWKMWIIFKFHFLFSVELTVCIVTRSTFLQTVWRLSFEVSLTGSCTLTLVPLLVGEVWWRVVVAVHPWKTDWLVEAHTHFSCRQAPRSAVVLDAKPGPGPLNTWQSKPFPLLLRLVVCDSNEKVNKMKGPPSSLSFPGFSLSLFVFFPPGFSW